MARGPLFYLHGVVPAADAGLGGKGLRRAGAIGALRAQGLAILYTDLSSVGLDSAALEAEIANEEAGEALVRDHQDVLCRLRDGARALLPFPFCTLYNRLDPLNSLLIDHRAAFESALARVAGAAEWSIRLVQDDDMHEQPPADPDLAALEAEIEAASPGRQFLLRHRLARDAKEHRRQVLRTRIDGLHTDLAGLARDAVRLAHAGADAHRRTAFKAAYLVADADRERFLERLDDRAGTLVRDGWQTVVQGPWPAYSFTSLDMAA